ncbi:acetoin utilization deacetylase AcuC-like enzyme [Rubricella aquisinus]|uniref:Acetoin utilization deacetylase AcuC-like enzyme n=1 Tax=Rubricella aquisinus TaxID=2028108 RepID=A0A840WQH4_9RHOB|nr:class II histone deacetylase [Rubricella aquisinus]MBB5515922.1 acetoin utilization deacetylase AcuC-like enzyme [Rubricella aquisinus]
MTTGFFTDERCFWHSGGNYALTMPVGGLVQPLAAGGLPESPETKRRLRNLVEVTGLIRDLRVQSADLASRADLERIHPARYLDTFKSASDAGGGELGERTPFGAGGYEIAALSAGLVKQALLSVLKGEMRNAYALSRPPGHHCEPEKPMGFCLLANIPVAIEAARAAGLARRFAVVDWDVHHGNGTETIYADDPDVLTISLHQEGNYPWDRGAVGAGGVANINIPLPPGTGHVTYLDAMDRIVRPALDAHKPDVILVASGFDASGVDPLARMLAGADTFGAMTAQMMTAAAELCDGRLVLAHEGGYSEAHVPFCGHAVLQTLSGSRIDASDPLAARIAAHQPRAAFAAFLDGEVTKIAQAYGFA